LLKTVGGNRRLRPVSVETCGMRPVSVETHGMKAVSVETPTMLTSPRVKDGLDREIANGSCRATRRLPAQPIRGLFTIQPIRGLSTIQPIRGLSTIQPEGCPQFRINECKKHYKAVSCV